MRPLSPKSLGEVVSIGVKTPSNAEMRGVLQDRSRLTWNKHGQQLGGSSGSGREMIQTVR